MNLKPNILYLTAWYPDRNDNMLGLFVQKHAVATLPYCNISVLYICSDKNLHDKKYDLDFTVEENIPTLRIYFRKSNLFLTGKLINVFRFWISFLMGYKFLKEKSGKFNLSHVHILTRCGILALYLKIFKNIPYIITEHWSRYLPYNLKRGSYKGIIRRWFTKLVVRNAEAVTSVTENLRNAMQNLGLHNTYYIIPNVVDIHRFYPLESKNPHSKKNILHVSCFDEKAKNIKGIINVIQRIAEKRPDFILEIVGDGADFKDVKQYAHQTGLVDKVIFFRGLLVDESLIKKMQESDFFLLFSNYENLPCTIVESLAVAVPVLSTDVGGIKEHIPSDFGKLIPPGDEIQLENAIIFMLDNLSEFSKARMRQYAVENFSNESIGTKFYEIYMKSLKYTP